jgi:HEAT repeats
LAFCRVLIHTCGNRSATLAGGGRGCANGKAGKSILDAVVAMRSPGIVWAASQWLVRLVVLLLPATLLGMAALRVPPSQALMLWLGAAFQALCCLLSLVSRQGWRQPIGPSAITLYVIALGWLWFGTQGANDWYPHLAQGLMLVVPVVVFAHQVLMESGASALRRARSLAQRLAHRTDWPTPLTACRGLPEVKAFREALHIDAAPALDLLTHRRAEVRVAALAALEFRKNWRRGQTDIVLQLARRAPEPEVRAAAITALANVDDRVLIETVSEFLRDPAPDVRRATTESLLWNIEQRWTWIRHAVHRCLGDPTFADDGPLCQDAEPLTDDAVGDLTAWAAEKGILGLRAALTLGVHYGRVLRERPDDKLIPQLREQLAKPQAPAALRVELANLLRACGDLDRQLARKLLEPTNPAPLRLLAVDCLLAGGQDPDESRAALRDLARLPNREIALGTAAAIQRYLGVDLGLLPDQPLPAVHTRHAAEVARRVMAWAAQHDVPCMNQ